MAPTLTDLFRTLSSFSPPRMSLQAAPWDEYVDWALEQGLIPLAAYNLEYRMAGAQAPEWVRDRLLSVYQGSVNDNVMKLVAFKRAVDGWEGAPWIVMGGASYAEALYPHVGFRPVLEVKLLVQAQTLDAVRAFFARQDFRPLPQNLAGEFPGAALVVSDGRTPVAIYTSLLAPERSAEEAQLFARALPMKVYGPRVFRMDLEDAILTSILEQSEAGYEVPLLTYVDLRELLLGAPALGGPYSRPCNPALVRERAERWGMARAAYVSLSVLAKLYPETQPWVTKALPKLRPASVRLLDRLAVEPLTHVGQRKTWRGLGRLRRWLAASSGARPAR